MSRESRVLIGVGGLAVIGLLLAVSGRMAVGLVVLVVGLVGGVVALRMTRPDTSDPFTDARAEADSSNTGTLTMGEPLAPWSPDGGLAAWTPPAGLAPPPADPFVDQYTQTPPPPAEPVAEPATDWDSTTWENSVSWDTRPSAPADTNPLDDLVDFDTLDPIAEVERIENRAAPSPTDSIDSYEQFHSQVDTGELDVHGNPIINENVTDADDIMAASQATELHLADGEQTELQKLLAKVQIRLSAYE